MADEYSRDAQLPTFKILLIGDVSVGKTCLLMRFTEDTFIENYSSSLGVDFKTKSVEVEGKNVKLQIWDFEGNKQRFEQIAKSRYADADAIIFLFDITNKESFDNIRGEWFQQVKNNKPKDTCCHMLVGTKTDLSAKRAVSQADAQKFAEEFKCPFIDTSAKVSTNVAQMFSMVAHDLVKKYGETDKQGHWKREDQGTTRKCILQ